jgi:hypothetical protein
VISSALVFCISTDLDLQRAEEQSTTMRALQKELDELRRDKERDSHRAREDGEELRLLREQCERLENEQSGGVSIVCHHLLGLILN